MEVKTVRDFLLLDLSKAHEILGCGRATQQQLITVQAELRGRLIPEGRVTPPDQDEVLRYSVKQPASFYSWRKLPLFSGLQILGLNAGELHPSYRPDCTIEQLAFARRAKQVLAERKITSLGELLVTPGLELIEPTSSGKRTLGQLRANVDEYLVYSLNSPLPTELDWGTPDGFLLSLTRSIIVDERQRRLLLERMGWQSKPRTLESLAREFGLTRERVRQIERAGLNRLLHWRSSAIVEPLHALICATLKELSPPISVKEICSQLQRRLAWNRPLHEKALAKILPSFRDLRCVDGRISFRAAANDWGNNGENNGVGSL